MNRNTILGILSTDEGEREITVREFLDLLNRVTKEGNRKAEDIDLTKTILKAISKTVEEHPDIVSTETEAAGMDYFARLLEELEGLPKGTALAKLAQYQAPKDLITNTVFGHGAKDNKGNSISLKGEEAVLLNLWETGKGRNRRQVAVYTRIEPNDEVLKAAGITPSRHPSNRAEELFNVMLSYALEDINILTPKMVAKIIFGISDSATLTNAQLQYIIKGAEEVFLTTIYLNTELTPNEQTTTTLKATAGISVTSAGQLFPGMIHGAIVNGVYVDCAIILTGLPVLYTIQRKLEKSQILRVPAELLNIPGRVDEDVILIRGYLLKRIDAMKHAPKLPKNIVFRNILDKVGIDQNDRAQRNKPAQALRRARRILDYWTQKRYIYGYAELNKAGQPIPAKGKTPYSILIFCTQEEAENHIKKEGQHRTDPPKK